MRSVAATEHSMAVAAISARHNSGAPIRPPAPRWGEAGLVLPIGVVFYRASLCGPAGALTRRATRSTAGEQVANTAGAK